MKSNLWHQSGTRNSSSRGEVAARSSAIANVIGLKILTDPVLGPGKGSFNGFLIISKSIQITKCIKNRKVPTSDAILWMRDIMKKKCCASSLSVKYCKWWSCSALNMAKNDTIRYMTKPRPVMMASIISVVG